MTFIDITQYLLLSFSTGLISGVIFGRVMQMLSSFGK